MIRRLMIAVLLVNLVAVPAFACKENCIREYVDTNGDGTPDAQTARCETVERGTLLTCDPIVRCWRMGGGARYCEAVCDGSPCYYV